MIWYLKPCVMGNFGSGSLPESQPREGKRETYSHISSFFYYFLPFDLIFFSFSSLSWSSRWAAHRLAHPAREGPNYVAVSLSLKIVAIIILFMSKIMNVSSFGIVPCECDMVINLFYDTILFILMLILIISSTKSVKNSILLIALSDY